METIGSCDHTASLLDPCTVIVSSTALHVQSQSLKTGVLLVFLTPLPPLLENQVGSTRGTRDKKIQTLAMKNETEHPASISYELNKA